MKLNNKEWSEYVVPIGKEIKRKEIRVKPCFILSDFKLYKNDLNLYLRGIIIPPSWE